LWSTATAEAHPSSEDDAGRCAALAGTTGILQDACSVTETLPGLPSLAETPQIKGYVFEVMRSRDGIRTQHLVSEGPLALGLVIRD